MYFAVGVIRICEKLGTFHLLLSFCVRKDLQVGQADMLDRMRECFAHRGTTEKGSRNRRSTRKPYLPSLACASVESGLFKPFVSIAEIAK